MVIIDFALRMINRLHEPQGTFQTYDPVANTGKSRKGLAFLVFDHSSFLSIETPNQESI